MNSNEIIESRAANTNFIVDKICRNWPTRSAVRNGEFVEVPEPFFDVKMRDFPTELVPFRNHPSYVELDEEIKRKVETLAWISWNKRVVDTEELVVTPALVALMNGSTDICLKGPAKTAIRQTVVDEYFHSHMHDVAVGVTTRGRKIPLSVVDRLSRPAWVYRSYMALASTLDHAWERDIARLAWCVIGELSIYEFLNIVSADEDIQPASRTLLRLHERDEAAHASLIAQIIKDHYHQLKPAQKSRFDSSIPVAMDGFSQEDWHTWLDILQAAEIPCAAEIISDTRNSESISSHLPLLRSFQRVQDFCKELGISLPAGLSTIKYPD